MHILHWIYTCLTISLSPLIKFCTVGYGHSDKHLQTHICSFRTSMSEVYLEQLLFQIRLSSAVWSDSSTFCIADEPHCMTINGQSLTSSGKSEGTLCGSSKLHLHNICGSQLCLQSSADSHTGQNTLLLPAVHLTMVRLANEAQTHIPNSHWSYTL